MELRIDREAVARARSLASAIVDPIADFIARHSTVSVERAVARLCGVDGVDADGIPLPNRLVDALRGASSALARALGAALAETGRTPQRIAEAVAAGEPLPDPAQTPEVALRAALRPHVESGLARLDATRRDRAALLARLPQSPPPLLYVIVASGNIYEDRTAAVAAAEAGAQIVAVIRSTAQSLLDYVPYGATTEGFGGTYATQENFRIMRAALDEASERLGRYVMLTNYASGLCMPEIAATAALERLDMLLNDSMYGILFRDINMQRTFVDQHFSRQLNARSGIVINTGEDNYLTTADAVEQAPAVLASQFVNEAFAHRAGLPDAQIGLGDAYEIDPDREDGFLFQVAQAQLARQIFPDAPLKYMPPTKHMTGDVFKGHLIDAMFNLTSVMTRADDPSVRDADRSDPYAVPRRPRARARERPLRDGDRAPLRRRDRAQAGRPDRAPRAARPGRSGAHPRRRRGARLDARDRGRNVRRRAPAARRRPRLRGRLRQRRGLLEPVRRRTGGRGRSRVTQVKPYGDTLNDGAVQLSFTLPIAWDEAADEAARQLVAKMGFEEVAVVEGRAIARGLLVLRRVRAHAGRDRRLGDPRAGGRRSDALSMEQVDELIARRLGRKVKIAGACIGTDAHTVGIDAILNMKGYKGDYGLERYRGFDVYNFGSQIAVEDLVRFVREHGVDAVLASQVVTQKGSDIANFTALAELLEAENLREQTLLIAGGPRVTNLLAAELGYDAGFGRGTLPSEVATFIARRLAERVAA